MKKVKLTIAELRHIVNLLHDNEESGIYYGNKEQYWRRAESIRKKLVE